MATLILMRHGETLSNRERRFQGQLDIELNEIGRLQAQQAAKRLAGEGISIIYSSDLRRAAESAEIVAATLDIPLVTDRRLRERHLGVLQGITVAEAEVQYPEELKNWRAGDVDSSPLGGESRRDIRERALDVVHEIRKKHRGEHVLVVSHGALLKTVLCELIGIPRENSGHFRLDNASLSKVEFRDDFPILTLLNETTHTRVAAGTEADSADGR